jgi:SAM-dependent methyltransferase
LQPISGAREYAALYRGTGPIADFFHERLTCVCEALKLLPPGRLLDIGCGPGILLKHLAGSGFDLFGVDLDPAMVAEAAAVTAGAQVSLAVGGIGRLPYASSTFDVVLALGVLEYVQDVEAALNEIARIARPNATIIVSMLNGHSAYWLWRRYIHSRFLRRLSRLAGHSDRCGDDLHLHDRKLLSEVMARQCLRPRSVIYYSLNVGLEPLSIRKPRFVSKLNTLCRHVVGERLSPLLRTAFLLLAMYVPDGLDGCQPSRTPHETASCLGGGQAGEMQDSAASPLPSTLSGV